MERSPVLEALGDSTRRAAVLALAEKLAEAKAEDEDGVGLYDDPVALVRYLRARNWDLDRAEALIRATGRWRQEFGFRDFLNGSHMDEVAQQSALGNIYVRGFDKKGRPAIYLKPGGEGWNADAAGIMHLVYCIERAVACLEQQSKQGKLVLDADDPTARKFVLLADFDGVGIGGLLPMTVARDLIRVMQDHYPERLGAAFFVNAPWLLSGFFSAASTFLDPVTVNKFHFVSEVGEERSSVMSKYFDLSVLEPEFGGTAEEPFQSHIFLSTASGDGVFGLEFSKQVELSGLQQAMEDDGHMEFLHVYRNARVLCLPAKERAAVRRLAKLLSRSLKGEEERQFFIQAGMLIRYLRAQSWQVEKAEASILSTVEWRKEFGLAHLRTSKCSAAIVRESASGRLYVRGFDRRRRPIVYVKFHHADCCRHEETLKYIIYVAERALAILQQQEEQVEELLDADCVTVIADFAEYSSSNRPSLRTLLAASRLLQDHYPEMLGQVYLLYPPEKILCLWRIVSAFLRQSTCEKVAVVNSEEHWSQLLSSVFHESVLERCVGGNNDVIFDSKVFLTRKVNGIVYGREFDEQFATADAACRQRVSFSLPAQPQKDWEANASSGCACQ